MTSPEPFTLDQLAPQQPKRRRTGLMVAAGVVVAAALFAVSFALVGNPHHKTLTSTKAVAATSPAEQVATVQQYASAMSPRIKAFRQTWADYEASSCTVETDAGDAACAIRSLTLNTEADTIVATLTGAARPGVPAYIGKPPAELDKLVGDTLAAAQAVVDVGNSDDKSGPRMFFACSSLATALDRWDPYLS